MKRTKNNYFGSMVGCPALVNYPVAELPNDHVKTEADKVFDYIYAPDPITRLPKNALGVYLSANESPVVREYIKQNLMGVESPAVPDCITEQDLEVLTRDRYETLEEYTQRVNSHVKSIKKEFGTFAKKYAEKVKSSKVEENK